MNNKSKTNKGITLIALIITVIVLLILAGTAVSISINGGNLFEKTNTAKAEWNNKVATEEQKVNEALNILNSMTEEEINNMVSGAVLFSSTTNSDKSLKITASINPESYEQLGISTTTENWIKQTDAGQYGFVEYTNYDGSYDGDSSIFVSNNKGINSSTASSTWKINLSEEIETRITYKVSSETNYDKLSIIVDNETKVNAISGAGNELSMDVSLSSGEHAITAQYVKDSSSASGDDQAYIILEPVTRGNLNNYVLKIGTDGTNYDTIAKTGITMSTSGKVYARLENINGEKLNESSIDIYAINYNANGGSGTMNASLAMQGNNVKILTSSFSRPSGKIFANWNENQNGTGQDYARNETITISDNMTLYAQWQDYSGLNPGDAATLTEKDNYEDYDGNRATIPAGFTVSGATGEHSIATGLVIYKGTDSVTDANVTTAQTDRDQYVWIPVDNSTTITWIYETADTTSLTSSIDATKEAAITLTTDFNAMKTSVQNYGGFYISRYELGGTIGNPTSRKGQVVANAGTDSSTGGVNQWYGLYDLAHQIKDLDGTTALTSIGAHMIFGSEYEKVLAFIDSNNPNYTSTGHPSKNEGKKHNSGIVTQFGKELDIINNIVDLEGNLVEWTARAYGSDRRIARSGYYIYASSFSEYGPINRTIYNPSNPYNQPNNTDERWTTRQTLYVTM